MDERPAGVPTLGEHHFHITAAVASVKTVGTGAIEKWPETRTSPTQAKNLATIQKTHLRRSSVVRCGVVDLVNTSSRFSFSSAAVCEPSMRGANTVR